MEIAPHIPEQAKAMFSALKESLTLSRDGINKNTGSFLIFNRSKPKKNVILFWGRHIKAIETVLTDVKFQEFWTRLPSEQIAGFYKVWSEAFNDWGTRPAISTKEKRRKLEQARGHISKVVSLMHSDPSLQHEIGVALNKSVRNWWPDLEETSTEIGAYEVLCAERLLEGFSLELQEITNPESQHSAHKGFPAQITQPTAEQQFFMRRLGPEFYRILGNSRHTDVANLLKALFPHIAGFSAEALRKQQAE